MWIVLARALATVLAPRDAGRAREILIWIEDQASATGDLPDQVTTHIREPEAKAGWVERWAVPARPLLLSHAVCLLGATASNR